MEAPDEGGREELELPPLEEWIDTVSVYRSASLLLLVGANPSRSRFRVLKVRRGARAGDEGAAPSAAAPAPIELDEDARVYSERELGVLLHAMGLHDGGTARLQRVGRPAYGVLGFVRFLGAQYLVLVSERGVAGHIGPHTVYSVRGTELVEVTRGGGDGDGGDGDAGGGGAGGGGGRRGSSRMASLRAMLQPTEAEKHRKRVRADDARYLSMFGIVDLTANVYFCASSYDATRSLQFNMVNARRPRDELLPKDMYAWNHFLLEPLREAGVSRRWHLTAVHGYFEQCSCSVQGRLLTITLAARRSRHFAGTRYRKRGLSDRGWVANDVEAEQIVEVDGRFTSHLQVRASIPLFWTQEGNAMVAKPPIVVPRDDPTHMATRLHFEDLLERYGSPVLAVNLVKQHERNRREMVIGGRFGRSVAFINQFLPPAHRVDYLAWDFKKVSKSRHASVVDKLHHVAEWALQRTGLFSSRPRPGAVQVTAEKTDGMRPRALDEPLYGPEGAGGAAGGAGAALPWADEDDIAVRQSGVLRVNCIDSLDRTNVAQFCVGKRAMAYQLQALGLLQSHSPTQLAYSNIVTVLLDMYERMGDSIALQYGGSQMHRQMKKDRSEIMSAPVLLRSAKKAGKGKELFVSLMRHYQNSFQDHEKQEAMNLFLGLYRPLVLPPPAAESGGVGVGGRAAARGGGAGGAAADIGARGPAWLVHTHDGVPFYVHRVTGERRWERPVRPEDGAVETPPETRARERAMGRELADLVSDAAPGAPNGQAAHALRVGCRVLFSRGMLPAEAEPREFAAPLWDLPTDYYLHSSLPGTAHPRYMLGTLYYADDAWWRRPVAEYAAANGLPPAVPGDERLAARPWLLDGGSGASEAVTGAGAGGGPLDPASVVDLITARYDTGSLTSFDELLDSSSCEHRVRVSVLVARENEAKPRSRGYLGRLGRRVSQRMIRGGGSQQQQQQRRGTTGGFAPRAGSPPVDSGGSANGESDSSDDSEAAGPSAGGAGYAPSPPARAGGHIRTSSTLHSIDEGRGSGGAPGRTPDAPALPGQYRSIRTWMMGDGARDAGALSPDAIDEWDGMSGDGMSDMGRSLAASLLAPAHVASEFAAFGLPAALRQVAARGAEHELVLRVRRAPGSSWTEALYRVRRVEAAPADEAAASEARSPASEAGGRTLASPRKPALAQLGRQPSAPPQTAASAEQSACAHENAQPVDVFSQSAFDTRVVVPALLDDLGNADALAGYARNERTLAESVVDLPHETIRYIPPLSLPEDEEDLDDVEHERMGEEGEGDEEGVAVAEEKGEAPPVVRIGAAAGDEPAPALADALADFGEYVERANHLLHLLPYEPASSDVLFEVRTGGGGGGGKPRAGSPRASKKSSPRAARASLRARLLGADFDAAARRDDELWEDEAREVEAAALLERRAGWEDDEGREAPLPPDLAAMFAEADAVRQASRAAVERLLRKRRAKRPKHRSRVLAMPVTATVDARESADTYAMYAAQAR